MSSSSEKPLEPFVYTPFFRRWTDERARDIRETQALHDSVRARYLSSAYSHEEAIKRFVLHLCEKFEGPLQVDFCVAMDGILKMEDSIFGFPDANLDHLSLKEQVDLARLLRMKDYFFDHEDKILLSLVKALNLIFEHIDGLLPKTLAPSPFVIPLAFALPDPKQLIDDIFSTLWREEYMKNGLFVNLTRQLYFNLCEVSGISDPEEPKRPFLHASKNAAPLAQIVDDYLKDTPLQDFLETPLPLQLTHEERFSHMHVLGGSNAGKTQLLQSLLLHDLMSEDRPTLIVVDSQGDLISKLLHLDLPFDPVLISPRDTPALNIFDVKRLGEYDEAKREQVTAGVIQTFDYLFSQLFSGLDMTGKQSVFFKMVSRMLIALPDTMGRNATVMDMLALMDDATPYHDAIRKLPPIQKHFFERDFLSKTFAQTKEQIRYRLLAILENPAMARLFTASETKLDLFTEMNNGAFILVDTDKAFLKDSSSTFGRIFISLVFQAVLERAVIPERKRKDTFLIVDEAAQYFSGQIDEMLSEVRKYKLGCTFSHQFLEQASPQLRASLNANTTIKMAGGVSTSDARSMAPEMRTTSDFILGQPKLHFACHIRNVTPQAVSIPVKAGQMEKHPRRSSESFDLLMARNRDRVCSGAHTGEPREQDNTDDLDSEDASKW